MLNVCSKSLLMTRCKCRYPPILQFQSYLVLFQQVFRNKEGSNYSSSNISQVQLWLKLTENFFSSPKEFVVVGMGTWIGEKTEGVM